MSRPITIKISWAKPVPFSEWSRRAQSENEYGIYMVTRCHSNGTDYNDPYLYIGLTKRRFTRRMSEHLKKRLDGCSNFLSAYGEKYVRFGTIETDLSRYDSIALKSIMEDTETHFIMRYQPTSNVMKKKSAVRWNHLHIINNRNGYLWKEEYNKDDVEGGKIKIGERNITSVELLNL